MAAETSTTTQTQTTSKRKPAARRKPVVRRKPVSRKASARKRAPDLAARARETGRNAFLAGLGFYGKAFDQAQEQFNSIQEQLEDRRQKADKLYQELVKRGRKVERDAKGAIKDMELPKIELDSLTDRKKLNEQLEKARARFEELKNNVSFRKAA